jgi:two-component system, sensor histidine kinase and response regulator
LKIGNIIEYQEGVANMLSYKGSQSFRDFSEGKVGMNDTESDNGSGIQGGMKSDVLNDLRQSNEQLREDSTALQTRNKELEVYAYMVAHDLKDPLTVLITASDLITNVPNLTRQDLKEFMQQIRFTAYEMNSIINNLLLFAVGGKADVPIEPVDMTRVVGNVRDRLSYMIKDQRARVVIPESWPDTIGYGPWIEEVWANYISNAIKHGGRPPYVELGASTQPDGMVRFWTRDNGPGLQSDSRTLLFTPYSQIGHIPNPGHGLGLSIVLQIVEKLGGQVGVESELGKGSLFFFTLPANSTST